jgi:hypothetical protein
MWGAWEKTVQSTTPCKQKRQINTENCYMNKHNKGIFTLKEETAGLIGRLDGAGKSRQREVFVKKR